MRLALALLLLGSPVGAETLTRSFAPRDEREALALSLLVAGLSLREHLDGGGSALDWLEAHEEALRDPADGDWALVRQRGEGHDAAVSQSGGGNALALLQFGEGAEADLAQEGREGAVVVQWGRPDRAPPDADRDAHEDAHEDVHEDLPRRPARGSAVVRDGGAGDGAHVEEPARGDRGRDHVGAVAHAHEDRPDLEPPRLHLEDVADP
jgi:hypothetical protein